MGDPGGYVPKQVKAVHPFKGSNNDELCLLKGEIITLTQTPEGGWWEGTLNGKTGWFPSNYVKEVKDVPGGSKAGPNMTAGTVITPDMPVLKRESMQYYHNVVLQNVIETERTHVSQMANFLQTYLRPLMSSGVLSPVEYSTLTGNLEDIAAFQQKFLSSIEECSNCSAHQRRVGGVFMKHAPHMKELYMAYCANHPRAVAQLQAKRVDLNKCMETIGAQPPGSMTLTTNLSKPFTRLDRYPSLLKELERHIEESHVDRGDTQRAIAVYRDIANSCMEIRKMKEMEFEIIESTIMGWEGEEMSLLGEVLHLSQVKVYIAGEKHDRIFVLFPSILVMLSMSPRLSGYQYEGKLPLSGMSVCMCDEAENIPNGFEISGNMIEKIVVSSTTETDQKTWIDLIGQQVLESQTSETSKHQSLQISTSQPSISTLTQAKTAEVVHSPCNYQAKTAEVGHSPCNYQPKTARVVHSTCNYQMNKTWSMSCLRPSPPLRPPLMYKEDSRPGRRPGRRKPDRTLSEDEYDYAWRRYDPQTMQEDGFILRVIDAYCTSAKTRHTVNSSVINCPSLIIPEEEKIIVDDGGDPAMIQEKSLVDTVYSLKDQVKALEQDHKRMRIDFEEEKKSRMRLESFIRKVLKNQVDLSWEEALA